MQTRNARGHVISLGVFDGLLTPEEATRQFGPRDYTLKRISPRFKVEWKHKVSSDLAQQSDGLSTIGQAIGNLEKKTKRQTYAIVGLGLVTGAGFVLSHVRFSGSEARLAQLEAIARTLSAASLTCSGCGNALDFMLQHFCNSCGMQLIWPKDKLPSPPSSLGNCSHCGHASRAGQSFCPDCGQACTISGRIVFTREPRTTGWGLP